ncbi:hypothetical protein Ahy_A02g007070 [Arachis hypogaea]|uniref:Pentatricopeptide repeat-containing protein n=1 Tax=Arachis hypogaea TaxID=3818 RepID=A0A445EC61_ARAHY|nr:hypothetical protein Ahy_A02g007070 [Arachis hypogaea]
MDIARAKWWTKQSLSLKRCVDEYHGYMIFLMKCRKWTTPDLVTYCILLDVLCKIQHLDEPITLFWKIIDKGFLPNVEE